MSLHFSSIHYPHCLRGSLRSTVLPSSSGDSFLLLVLWGEAPYSNRLFTFCTSPALTANVSGVSPPTAVLSSRLSPWAATDTNTTHRGQHVHSWSSYRTASCANLADEPVKRGSLAASWPAGWKLGAISQLILDWEDCWHQLEGSTFSQLSILWIRIISVSHYFDDATSPVSPPAFNWMWCFTFTCHLYLFIGVTSTIKSGRRLYFHHCLSVAVSLSMWLA